jgi:hypothetical protein
MIGKFVFKDDDISKKMRAKGYDKIYTISDKVEDGYKTEDLSEEDDDDDEEVTTTKKKKQLPEDPELSVRLIDTLYSKNWSAVGSTYFDLPSTEEMIYELRSR